MKKTFEKVSEKILPHKIKNIIWHKHTDLIIVNSGKQFEVQRISFKHETIFKREEKCEIVQIIILDSKELIAVILSDGTVNYLNVNNGEITLSSSVKKADQPIINQINSSTASQTEDLSVIPFKDDLVFNSFSKLDISKVSFLNNTFSFSHFFILDKVKNKVDFYLNLLINYAHLSIQGTIPPIAISPFGSNSLIFFNQINSNDYVAKTLSFSPELLNEINIVNYQIASSLSMIDYIIQILSIITKIITKLGIILFDKYSFANNFQYMITANNEWKYLKQLNEELKQLFLQGKIPENLMPLFQNDFFEGKTIYKTDKNIYFNLKNVQDILLENIKPVLNRLLFYFNELKFSKLINKSDDMKMIDIKFGEVYHLFEEAIKNLLNLNYDYRNFLSWLLVFNKDNKQGNNEKDTAKNSLNNLSIDYERCFSFINKEEYTMQHILDQIEGESTVNESLNLKEKKENVTPLLSTKNICLRNYLKKNNISIDSDKNTTQFFSSIITHNKENKSIKEALSQLKQLIVKVQSSLYDKTSELFDTLPQELFLLKNVQSQINDMILIQNESGNQIFYFTNHFSLKSLLFILIYIPSTQSFMIGKINFTYENSITILSFQITSQNELILLVKSTSQSYQVKYTIILSDLANYSFSPLDNDSKTFDLFNIENIEDIKITSFADVEASDSSFISLGERRLIALVNNSINKITIIDILTN